MSETHVKRLPLIECQWENNGVRYTGRKRVTFPDRVVEEHNLDIKRASAICENQWVIFQKAIDESNRSAHWAEIELDERTDQWWEEHNKMEEALEAQKRKASRLRKKIKLMKTTIEDYLSCQLSS
jgi:hypothetical protein